MRLEERCPIDRPPPLPLAEELLRGVEVTRLECRLDALDERALREHMPRREPPRCRELLLDRLQRLPQSPLRAQDARDGDRIAGAHLHLVRSAKRRVLVNRAARPLDVAPIDEQKRPDRQPVDGGSIDAGELELREQGVHLLPLAQYEEEVKQVPDRHPLLDAVALPARVLEPLEVDAPCLGEVVAGDQLVGEVVERTPERQAEVVPPTEGDRVFKKRERLLFAALLVQHQVLRVQCVDEHGGNVECLGDLDARSTRSDAPSLSPRK